MIKFVLKFALLKNIGYICTQIMAEKKTSLTKTQEK